jgi:hypothetical protein
MSEHIYSHTPAPWGWDDAYTELYSLAYDTTILADSKGDTLIGFEEIDLGNARLIAAAPVLLHAVKKLLANCHDVERDDATIDAIGHAKYAILAATGEMLP